MPRLDNVVRKSGHQGVALHEGGHDLLRRRRAAHLGAAGHRRARLDHRGRRPAHDRLAGASRRGGDRLRDGLRAPRLRRGRLLHDEPHRRAAARRHGHDHAVRAVHRERDGHLKERGWAYFAGLFAGSIAVAFLVGGLVWRLLTWSGWRRPCEYSPRAHRAGWLRARSGVRAATRSRSLVARARAPAAARAARPTCPHRPAARLAPTKPTPARRSSARMQA